MFKGLETAFIFPLNSTPILDAPYPTYYNYFIFAGVAELADAADLKSAGAILVGSSPTPGTTLSRDFRRRGDNGMDEGVKNYIEKQKSPQKETLLKLREIIVKNFPGIREQMKWGVPEYEGRYYIVALKDHVNLGFFIKRLSPEEEALLEGSGKTMKHIKVSSPDDIDEKRIARLLNMVKG